MQNKGINFILPNKESILINKDYKKRKENRKIKMKCIKGYLHSYSEASLIMHAVRLGIIEPIKERLSGNDREKITSGCIFVFIESESGIKRWTDGKIWSPSKILGHFLLYKEVPKYLSKSSIKKRNALEKYQEKIPAVKIDPPNDEFCLFKKTISIKHEDKSYHIISYFQPIFDKKGIIEYPFFRSLNSALIENSGLMIDDYLHREFLRNIDFHSKYSILEYRGNNIIPEYDRRPLEKNAIAILSSKFGSQYNRDV